MFDWCSCIIVRKSDTDLKLNFCCVESNTYIMLMYLVCVHLEKKKKKLGHSRLEWNDIATHTAGLSAFYMYIKNIHDLDELKI